MVDSYREFISLTWISKHVFSWMHKWPPANQLEKVQIMTIYISNLLRFSFFLSKLCLQNTLITIFQK